MVNMSYARLRTREVGDGAASSSGSRFRARCRRARSLFSLHRAESRILDSMQPAPAVLVGPHDR